MRRMPKEFTKRRYARQCVSCRSNRLSSRIFNRFIARVIAASVLEQPLSTIYADFLASMALFCRKAHGVSWRKRTTPSPAPNCQTSRVNSSPTCSMNSAASISGSINLIDSSWLFAGRMKHAVASRNCRGSGP